MRRSVSVAPIQAILFAGAYLSVTTSMLTPVTAAASTFVPLQNLTRTDPAVSTRSTVALTPSGRLVGPGNEISGKSVIAAPTSDTSAVLQVLALTAGRSKVVAMLVPDRSLIDTDPGAI